jgi:hypothetical protein
MVTITNIVTETVCTPHMAAAATTTPSRPNVPNITVNQSDTEGMNSSLREANISVSVLSTEARQVSSSLVLLNTSLAMLNSTLESGNPKISEVEEDLARISRCQELVEEMAGALNGSLEDMTNTVAKVKRNCLAIAVGGNVNKTDESNARRKSSAGGETSASTTTTGSAPFATPGIGTLVMPAFLNDTFSLMNSSLAIVNHHSISHLDIALINSSIRLVNSSGLVLRLHLDDSTVTLQDSNFRFLSIVTPGTIVGPERSFRAIVNESFIMVPERSAELNATVEGNGTAEIVEPPLAVPSAGRAGAASGTVCGLSTVTERLQSTVPECTARQVSSVAAVTVTVTVTASMK